MMTGNQVLDMIRQEFRAMRLPLPEGLSMPSPVWQRIAQRIVIEAENERRAAARAASMVGFAVMRGRTRL